MTFKGILLKNSESPQGWDDAYANASSLHANAIYRLSIGPGVGSHSAWPCLGIRGELIQCWTKYSRLTVKQIALYGPSAMLQTSKGSLAEERFPTPDLDSRLHTTRHPTHSSVFSSPNLPKEVKHVFVLHQASSHGKDYFIRDERFLPPSNDLLTLTVWSMLGVHEVQFSKTLSCELRHVGIETEALECGQETHGALALMQRQLSKLPTPLLASSPGQVQGTEFALWAR